MTITGDALNDTPGESTLAETEGRRIISAYMATIGRKGGSSGAGANKARSHELARKAGLASAARRAELRREAQVLAGDTRAADDLAPADGVNH